MLERQFNYYLFTMFFGCPSKNALIFSAVVSIIRSRASFVLHALCGVMMQFLAVNNGLLLSGGSFDNTSSAAPAIVLLFRALARSCSFTSWPREVLMRYEDGFIS